MLSVRVHAGKAVLLVHVHAGKAVLLVHARMGVDVHTCSKNSSSSADVQRWCRLQALAGCEISAQCRIMDSALALSILHTDTRNNSCTNGRTVCVHVCVGVCVCAIRGWRVMTTMQCNHDVTCTCIGECVDINVCNAQRRVGSTYIIIHLFDTIRMYSSTVLK